MKFALTTIIKQFTNACHDELPSRPVFISPENIEFITKMVNDEMAELKCSSSIPEQADALADAIYYICDTAIRHGMNLDTILDIVHNANMKKVVNGKVIRREDGKILKPAGWQDPKDNLYAEVTKQEDLGTWHE